MTKYLRDKEGKFKKGTPQPFGFRKGKQKVPWNFKGGSLDSYGHRIIYINTKRVREQRYIWEKHNGKIPEGYIIHHINCNPSDNRIENLKCMSKSEHKKLHMELKKCQS